jgi:signal transduction histidine kinase
VAQEPGIDIVKNDASLQFEELLALASGAFIRASANEIGGHIKKWLERFSLALGIHKAVLVQLDPTDGKLHATHQWVAESMLPTTLSSAAQDYPWVTSKLMSGELIVLDDVDDAPSAASNDLLMAHRRGGKAAVCVPLKIGGELAGAVAFASAVRRKWTAETVQLLQRLTEIFGFALERQRSSTLIRSLRQESQNILRIVPMAEVSASMAHELNQPLGAILNNAQAARRLLRHKSLDIEELNEAVEAIIRDVDRATHVVRHTRDAFRSITGETGPLDLRELLLNVERLLTGDAEARGVSLRLNVPVSLPSVIGNRQGLIQVLMNLILNAFDSVAECPDGKRVVGLSADHDSTEAHVRVRDNGKGIDPRIRPRLFNAFATTKPKGTGMGLAIARSIIEKNGGRIWADEKAAPGASIEFTLPIHLS